MKFISGLAAVVMAAALVACPTSVGSGALEDLKGPGSGGNNPSPVNPVPGAAISGEIRIALTPGGDFSGIKGKAKYKNRGGERELEVEVENLSRLSGQAVSVCLNDARVGGAVINSFGNAEMNLNSDRGQTVPAVTFGSSLKVWLGASCNGSLIASGAF